MLIETESSLTNNVKDDIEGLEKWFNDNLSKINDKQNSVLTFVQSQVGKLKAEAHEKNTNIDDPKLNQEILNYTLHDYGFNKIKKYNYFF